MYETKQRETLVCDRCGRTYADEESILEAKVAAGNWRKMCLADGVEPRGICPCPDVSCWGELLLREAQ